MTMRDTTSVGAPCWVDTFQPDPGAATDFYGALFGWTFDKSTSRSTVLPGDYLLARRGGKLVAGIRQAPPSTPPSWNTYVRVDDITQTLARAEHAGGTRIVGPLEAGRDGHLAVLADSTGVPFGLWQAEQRLGAELVDEPNSWAMSSLHTTDLDRAQDFYGGLFGWESKPVPGAGFSKWRRADRVVAVVTATDGVSVPPHWSVNFAVDDADAVAERAVALGGTVLMAPMSTPGLRNAVISDPQGGVLAISAPDN